MPNREKISDAEIEKTLKSGAETAVRELAGKYRNLAIDTLRDCMRNKDSTWSSRVSAANSILAYADGRPTQQYQAPGRGDGGITINILRLSEGTREQIVVDVPKVDGKIQREAESEAMALLGG